jgi:hypothetical protein
MAVACTMHAEGAATANKAAEKKQQSKDVTSNMI